MTVRHVDVRTHVDIAASRTVVWDAITGDVSPWWGAPYLLLPHPQSIHVEHRLGGSVREETTEAAALWGLVSFIDPPRTIAWQGPMGMDPTATGTVTISLRESTARDTAVTLEHQAIGVFGEDTRASYDHGWNDLLQRLRILLESGDAYGISGLNRAAPDPRQSHPPPR